jgi:hypothetical protein
LSFLNPIIKKYLFVHNVTDEETRCVYSSPTVVCALSGQRNTNGGGRCMATEKIERSTGLDRMATRNEVRLAILFSVRDIFEPVDSCDNLTGMEAAFGGCLYNTAEDRMWLAIVNEMPDSKSN